LTGRGKAEMRQNPVSCEGGEKRSVQKDLRHIESGEKERGENQMITVPKGESHSRPNKEGREKRITLGLLGRRPNHPCSGGGARHGGVGDNRVYHTEDLVKGTKKVLVRIKS